MVAHTRKTPGAGPLRSVTPKAVTPKALTPATSGAVNQSLQFRSLNLPVPIEVVEDGLERPVSVTLPPARSSRPTRSRRPAQGGRSLAAASLAVTAINDLWQVDDEWWRERPISRRYYQITTQDERRLTIFRDQLNAQWYWQRGGGEAGS
ncbi:MAG: hypothetical protein IIB89_03610 [Chloroflexi bacterium]|nr:hypothetical protein [Chloroflexota bacterium]